MNGNGRPNVAVSSIYQYRNRICNLGIVVASNYITIRLTTCLASCLARSVLSILISASPNHQGLQYPQVIQHHVCTFTRT